MQSHEMLREVLKTTSAKQVAADLGLSLSLIYKWAEPPSPDYGASSPDEGGHVAPKRSEGGSGAANPLDRIEQLVRSTRDERLVQWICEKAGGFYIRNPKRHHAHPDYLIPATNQIVQEFADLLAVIATAAADNHINKTEAKTIRRRWEELKSVTECFVHCCEEGNFSKLKELQLEGGAQAK